MQALGQGQTQANPGKPRQTSKPFKPGNFWGTQVSSTTAPPRAGTLQVKALDFYTLNKPKLLPNVGLEAKTRMCMCIRIIYTHTHK